MLSLDTKSIEHKREMSLIEPRLNDLRSGFRGYGTSVSATGLASSSMLPLWPPPLVPPASWCTIPSCQCAMSISRSYMSLTDFYDYPGYSSYTSWSSWYLKAGKEISCINCYKMTFDTKLRKQICVQLQQSNLN